MARPVAVARALHQHRHNRLTLGKRNAAVKKFLQQGTATHHPYSFRETRAVESTGIRVNQRIHVISPNSNPFKLDPRERAMLFRALARIGLRAAPHQVMVPSVGLEAVAYSFRGILPA